MHRWSVRIAALTGALALLAIGGYGVALALRPNPEPPVNGITLHESLERAAGSIGASGDDRDACVKRRRPGWWDCDVSDRRGSGGASYRLQVPASGTCWTARLTDDYSEGGMPKRVRGCVNDNWSFWDMVL